MPEVYKLSIISTPSKNFQPIHKKKITQSLFLQNLPSLSTQFIPTIFYPTVHHGPFLFMYYGNLLRNI